MSTLASSTEAPEAPRATAAAASGSASGGSVQGSPSGLKGLVASLMPPLRPFLPGGITQIAQSCSGHEASAQQGSRAWPADAKSRQRPRYVPGPSQHSAPGCSQPATLGTPMALPSLQAAVTQPSPPRSQPHSVLQLQPASHGRDTQSLIAAPGRKMATSLRASAPAQRALVGPVPQQANSGTLPQRPGARQRQPQLNRQRIAAQPLHANRASAQQLLKHEPPWRTWRQDGAKAWPPSLYCSAPMRPARSCDALARPHVPSCSPAWGKAAPHTRPALTCGQSADFARMASRRFSNSITALAACPRPAPQPAGVGAPATSRTVSGQHGAGGRASPHASHAAGDGAGVAGREGTRTPSGAAPSAAAPARSIAVTDSLTLAQRTCAPHVVILPGTDGIPGCTPVSLPQPSPDGGESTVSSSGSGSESGCVPCIGTDGSSQSTQQSDKQPAAHLPALLSASISLHSLPADRGESSTSPPGLQPGVGPHCSDPDSTPQQPAQALLQQQLKQASKLLELQAASAGSVVLLTALPSMSFGSAKLLQPRAALQPRAPAAAAATPAATSAQQRRKPPLNLPFDPGGSMHATAMRGQSARLKPRHRSVCRSPAGKPRVQHLSSATLSIATRLTACATIAQSSRARSISSTRSNAPMRPRSAHSSSHSTQLNGASFCRLQ